jgi:phosphate transport system substrate-binding protein
MRRWGFVAAAVALLAAVAVAAASVVGEAGATRTAPTATLTGAGATFPAPLIAVWQQRYTQHTINYQPIGSGGGIAAITARTVDFGASDAPLTPDQFTACKGCVQIPWVLSATAVLYNLPNVKNNLHINGRVLADIYLGKITQWNDARIRALNRGVSLPDTKINPVYRSDGSGTTFNFTDYLSTVSPEFKSRVGNSTSVQWPVGVGGRGSSGLAGIVTRTEGAIGYADVAYALQNKIKFMAVQNRSGKYALPGLRGIKAASLSDVKPNAANAYSIVNPPRGKKYVQAYPICTYSYVLLALQTKQAAAVKQFVNWAMTTGQQYGPRILFYPISKAVVARNRTVLNRVQQGG